MNRQNRRRERRLDKERAGPDPFATSHVRLRICEEAARIMAEQGVRDFQLAKEKAALRLGFPRRKTDLPSNLEVEGALSRRLRLFSADSLEARQKQLLAAAATAMDWLSEFQPRLAGALLRGSVTERTPVELHVFADTSEEVFMQLVETGARVTTLEKRVRYSARRHQQVPVFSFDLDEAPIEVLSFRSKEIREAPLCPVEGRPMTRVPLGRVREILCREPVGR
jgi:hypothetical protein